MDPDLRREVVEFLRAWLPEQAAQVYREMMDRDPVNWSRDPHFAGGIIVEHALRGNGLTEQALGVPDLEALWPGLLEEALREEGPV